MVHYCIFGWTILFLKRIKKKKIELIYQIIKDISIITFMISMKSNLKKKFVQLLNGRKMQEDQT